jgi:hypothetical protein
MIGTMARQIKTVRIRWRAGELWLGRLGIQAKHDAYPFHLIDLNGVRICLMPSRCNRRTNAAP